MHPQLFLQIKDHHRIGLMAASISPQDANQIALLGVYHGVEVVHCPSGLSIDFDDDIPSLNA